MKRYTCIPAADLVVQPGATVVDVTHFTAQAIPLEFAFEAMLTLYCKGGNAGNSGDVTFNFVTYDGDRALWDTEIYLSLPLTMSGVLARQQSFALVTAGEKIKLYSIVNGDATALHTVTVNASIYIKFLDSPRP